ERPAESPIGGARVVECGLRRGREQLVGAVEAVELEKDGSGILGAASPHHRKGSFAIASADVGRHPDRGFQAHRSLPGADEAYSVSGAYSSGRPVMEASSRTTRCDNCPVTGSLRSRSN